MNPVQRLLPQTATLTEEDADRYSLGLPDRYAVEAHPPQHSIPSTLDETVAGILEFQTKFWGIGNASPRITYEIIRATPERLRFQFTVPTKRLERKLRTHLAAEIPGIEFSQGTTKLPVGAGDSIGGGLLSNGEPDHYPLRREFDRPPVNHVAASLHRHAMRDTRFVVQLLFRPLIGKPVRHRYWIRKAYKQIGFLRKEKEKLWGSRNATPREKRQADAIENKAGSTRWTLTIRLLVIDAGEYTASRIKELSGGFNIFEDLDTGQYLNTETLRAVYPRRLLRFLEAVRTREFQSWHHRFQVSSQELAALVSLPNQEQENIRHSQK